jgi:hypothetical protein
MDVSPTCEPDGRDRFHTAMADFSLFLVPCQRPKPWEFLPDLPMAAIVHDEQSAVNLGEIHDIIFFY